MSRGSATSTWRGSPLHPTHRSPPSRSSRSVPGSSWARQTATSRSRGGRAHRLTETGGSGLAGRAGGAPYRAPRPSAHARRIHRSSVAGARAAASSPCTADDGEQEADGVLRRTMPRSCSSGRSRRPRSRGTVRVLALDGIETEANGGGHGDGAASAERRHDFGCVESLPPAPRNRSSRSTSGTRPTVRAPIPRDDSSRFVPEPDGRYRLDFNRARNPFCAYSSAFPCPAPWRGNTIEATVRGGRAVPRRRAERAARRAGGDVMSLGIWPWLGALAAGGLRRPPENGGPRSISRAASSGSA